MVQRLRYGYAKTDGMTKVQAAEMRKTGAQIWGCWWCLNAEPTEAPYFFAEDCIVIGHYIACPKHRNQT